MAFNAANIQKVAFFGNTYHSPFLWDYSTSDNLADVEDEAGTGEFPNSSVYFSNSDASERLRPMDTIRVTASDGKGLYLVIKSEGGGTNIVELKKLASVSSFIWPA